MSASCERFRDEVADRILAGETLPRALTEHFAVCEDCQALAEELNEISDARRQLMDRGLPADMQARVWASVKPTAQRASRKAREPSWGQSLAAVSRWRPAWAGALVGAAALWLVLGPLDLLTPSSSGRATDVAEIVEHSGDVNVVAAGQKHPIRGATALQRGDRLETGAKARATVRLPDEQLVLMEHTAMVVGRLERDTTEVEVVQGRAVIRVRPDRNRKRKIRVRLRRSSVSVVGTVFWVQSQKRRDEVSVWHGKVHVQTSGEEELEVVAGQRLTIDAVGARLSSLDNTEGQAMIAALEGRPFEAVTPSVEPVPDVPQNDPDDEPAPSKRRKLRSGQNAHGHAEQAVAKIEQLCGDQDLRAAEQTARELKPEAPDFLRAHAFVLVANCSFGAGDVQSALRLYREVSRRFPKTAAGQNATYEIGRIALQRDDSAQAISAFNRYLKRYRHGPLASEALFRTCVLHMEGEDFKRALHCAKRYQKRFPKGKRASQAILMEATVHRSTFGDCEAAIEAYERYLADPDDYEDEARSWRQWCIKRLGGQ